MDATAGARVPDFKRPFSGRWLESARTICSTGVLTLGDGPFMGMGGSTSAPGFMPSTMVKQLSDL
jgi:hypothetical protein